MYTLVPTFLFFCFVTIVTSKGGGENPSNDNEKACKHEYNNVLVCLPVVKRREVQPQ
jgi:hypothetical protein